jgi:hypothetical protein
MHRKRRYPRRLRETYQVKVALLFLHRTADQRTERSFAKHDCANIFDRPRQADGHVELNTGLLTKAVRIAVERGVHAGKL